MRLAIATADWSNVYTWLLPSLGGVVIFGTLLYIARLNANDNRFEIERLRKLRNRSTLTAEEQSYIFYRKTIADRDMWLEFATAINPLLPEYFQAGKLRPTDGVWCELASLIGIHRLGDEPDKNALYSGLKGSHSWSQLDFGAEFVTVGELFRLGSKDVEVTIGGELTEASLTPMKFSRHPNGGGIVATTATVSDDARVEFDAIVLDHANISAGSTIAKSSRIFDFARLSEGVRVDENCTIFGFAMIGRGAKIGSNSALGGSIEIRPNEIVATDSVGSDIAIWRRVLAGRFRPYCTPKA
jgi:acetyltransferase-like isoleucine patch superfamily enzyme